jgi:putative transposase
VPRVRDGSFFPGLLEPRKRAERALVATVREVYVQGVSRRRVDDLVKALGLEGIPRARSAACAKSWIRKSSAFARASWRGATPTCG